MLTMEEEVLSHLPRSRKDKLRKEGHLDRYVKRKVKEARAAYKMILESQEKADPGNGMNHVIAMEIVREMYLS